VKITTFEDIKAWQASRTLAKMVYDAMKSNKSSSNDYKFREQIQSATVSIMSNIAEGFSRRTTKEFTQFLFIAKGSAAEVQSQLYVALDQEYVNQEKFNELYSKSDEVARLLSGFIQYLLKAERQTQRTQRTKRTQETQRTGEEWSKGR